MHDRPMCLFTASFSFPTIVDSSLSGHLLLLSARCNCRLLTCHNFPTQLALFVLYKSAVAISCNSFPDFSRCCALLRKLNSGVRPPPPPALQSRFRIIPCFMPVFFFLCSGGLKKVYPVQFMGFKDEKRLLKTDSL
ncbi:hypothetical protein ABFS83_05G017400 [Erythranthe nasuta]